MRAFVWGSVVVMMLLSTGLRPVRAEDKPAPKPPAMQPAFEQVKKLAGEWVPLDKDGKPGDKVSHIFRVTAAGSAVVENLFPGTNHEMVTVYHLDDDDLMLTHYCAAGNQPRMKAQRGGDGRKLVFDFAGATNLKSDKDMHMHAQTIVFLEEDRIRVEYQGRKDGKPEAPLVLNLARKKK